eukprot:313133_1
MVSLLFAIMCILVSVQSGWSDVMDILVDNGMGRYADLFITYQINDILTAAKLNDATLQEMGITLGGHRARIIRAFQDAAIHALQAVISGCSNGIPTSQSISGSMTISGVNDNNVGAINIMPVTEICLIVSCDEAPSGKEASVTEEPLDGVEAMHGELDNLREQLNELCVQITQLDDMIGGESKMDDETEDTLLRSLDWLHSQFHGIQLRMEIIQSRITQMEQTEQ